MGIGLRCLVGFALCVALVGNVAASKPPAPSPAVSSQDQQNQPTTTAKGPNADRGGSKESPLFVQQVVAQPSEAAAKAETDKREEESSNARRSMWATVATAIFTGVLTISTILLWLDTRQMRMTSERASRALVLPAITDKSKLYQKRTVPASDPHRPEMTFAWENFGQTPAIVHQSKYALVIAKHPPQGNIAAIKRGKTRLDVIRGGQTSAEIKVSLPEITLDQATGLRARGDGGEFLRFFFVGEVVYEDVFGRRYARDFCIKVFPGLSASFKRNTERTVNNDYGAKKADEDAEADG